MTAGWPRSARLTGRYRCMRRGRRRLLPGLQCGCGIRDVVSRLGRLEAFVCRLAQWMFWFGLGEEFVVSVLESWGDTDRDVIVVGLVAMICACSFCAMGVLVSAAVLMTSLFGGPATIPSWASWGSWCWALITHYSDPGSGLPPPWSVIAGH